MNHIDTSDYYGPHVTNQIDPEALHPYSDGLVIVTKIGDRRGKDGSVLPALSPTELRQAVRDNLRNLGLHVLHVVNFRNMRCRKGIRLEEAAAPGAKWKLELCRNCVGGGPKPPTNTDVTWSHQGVSPGRKSLKSIARRGVSVSRGERRRNRFPACSFSRLRSRAHCAVTATCRRAA